MFVILAYDVRERRVAKVRKRVAKYLRPVQKSVWEGSLSEGLLNRLKQELAQTIDPEEDSVRLYRFDSIQHVCWEEIGVHTNGDSFLL